MSDAELPDDAAPSRWTQSTVYADMWADPDDDPRETGVETTDERSTLLDYLRRYRLTLRLKCADLDADQLARRSVPPSTMSLLGLVRHLADVERYWFRQVMARHDAPPLFRTAENRDAAFDDAIGDPAMVEQAWQAWQAEVSFAEQYTDATADLTTTGTMRDGDTVLLRDVLVHMIEEYARHCGHAYLLRERIDGRVGQ
ncbi:MAG: DinB family protein [Acidothermaceae bacterium]